MAHKLIMVDHASMDIRSMSAMLRGNGDGREYRWQCFEDAHPGIEQEVLMEQFRIEARYGRIVVNRRFFDRSFKKHMVMMTAIAIIVA